ncbi:hypothetical protein [Streptomyces sp. B1I3]|uniref:hypothetical protein n=1 Tax=Streptomyces sp. B1I3 TaxID=3042264 RepID=UPI00277E59C5|nr:hypothetical protein [Streptomyces sp. B1I3]MDQ0798357.1 hypothetical protein [Streptomyces sp. B1I3]
MQPEHRHDMGRDRDQTFKDGEEVVTLQETRFRQQGELMCVETTTQGLYWIRDETAASSGGRPSF